MAVYEKSYTSGTRDTEPSIPAIRTVASEARITIREPYSTHSTSTKSWIPWVNEQLDEIAQLEAGWDSYGADPIAPQAIALAADLLHLVDEKLSRVAFDQSWPQIVTPRADGGVQIEWGTPPVQIAVHADPSGNLGYLYKDRQGEVIRYEEKQGASLDQILQKIATVVFVARR
jgi:hypothetical protein